MGFRDSLHGTNPGPLMSALGQKQASQHVRRTSALTPKADIGTQSWNVCFVPIADSCTAASNIAIRSPRGHEAESNVGTDTPIALAVFRLRVRRGLIRSRVIGRLNKVPEIHDASASSPAIAGPPSHKPLPERHHRPGEERASLPSPEVRATTRTRHDRPAA